MTDGMYEDTGSQSIYSLHFHMLLNPYMSSDNIKVLELNHC